MLFDVFGTTALESCREVLAVGGHDFIHGGSVSFVSVVVDVDLGWDNFH